MDLPNGSTMGGTPIVTEGSLRALVSTSRKHKTLDTYPVNNKNKWTKLADIRIGRDSGYAAGDIIYTGGNNGSTKTQQGIIRFRLKVSGTLGGAFLPELYITDYQVNYASDVAMVIEQNDSTMLVAGIYLFNRDDFEKFTFSSRQPAQFEGQITLQNEPPWLDALPAGAVYFSKDRLHRNYMSLNSQGTANQWFKFASVDFQQDAKEINAFMTFAGGAGSNADSIRGLISIRLRNRVTGSPAVVGEIVITNANNKKSLSNANVVGLITASDSGTGKSTVELYMQNPNTSDEIMYTPLSSGSGDNAFSSLITFYGQQPYLSALPTGTQIAARYADGRFLEAAADRVKMTPLTAAPASTDRASGMIVAADGQTWDPNSKGDGKPYLLFYDGTNYQRIGYDGGGTSIFTSNNSFGTGNQWFKFAAIAFQADTKAVNAAAMYSGGASSNADSVRGFIHIRLRNNAAGSPVVVGEIIVQNVNNKRSITNAQVVGVIISTNPTTGQATIELYMQNPYTSEEINLFPIYQKCNDSANPNAITWFEKQAYVSALPAGTQLSARYPDSKSAEAASDRVRLTALGSAPTAADRIAGAIYLADPAGGWNPLGISGATTIYPVLYDGAKYQKIGLQADGTKTFTGDGTALVFTIPHGLGRVPSSVMLSPRTSAAKGYDHYDYDDTNITITFTTAPSNGWSVKYDWHASLGG